MRGSRQGPPVPVWTKAPDHFGLRRCLGLAGVSLSPRTPSRAPGSRSCSSSLPDGNAGSWCGFQRAFRPAAATGLRLTVLEDFVRPSSSSDSTV